MAYPTLTSATLALYGTADFSNIGILYWDSGNHHPKKGTRRCGWRSNSLEQCRIQTGADKIMALVLCTGIDKTLLETRALILEKAGHTVVTASDEKTMLAACDNHSFDVVVIGQTVSPKMKGRVAGLIREHCPSAKILELYQPHTGKMLDDADSWLIVPADVPRDLADRVEQLASESQR
jgi:CheY-like chemotaxis protein